MTSAEQLYLSMCLDGLPISILGVSDSTLNVLQNHTIECIEHTARLVAIHSAHLRNDIIDAIEHDLRARLNEYTVHCYTLLSDEMSPSQFVIESSLFHFVASLGHDGQRCTCVYRWSNAIWLSSVPFQDPGTRPVPQQTSFIGEGRFAAPVSIPPPSWPGFAPPERRPAMSGYRTSSQAIAPSEAIRPPIPSPQVECKITQELAATHIEHLNLSTRTKNTLIRGDIRTLGQLVAMNDTDLLLLRNFGMSMLQEVRDMLKEMGSPTGLHIVKPNGQLPTLQQRYNIAPDLAHLPISKLGLTTRTYNALLRAGIATLGGIGESTEAELCSYNGIGQSTLDEIYDRLAHLDRAQLLQETLQYQDDEANGLDIATVDLSASVIQDDALLENSLPEASVDEIVARFLRHLEQREYQIITLRYGLAGNRKHTLEEVGSVVGCTRERIRQIEKRAISKLHVIKSYRIIKPLVLKLEEALVQSHAVMSLHTAVDILYGEEELPDHAANTVFFILTFAANVQETKGLPILCLTNPTFVEATQHINEICLIFKKIITDALAPLPVADVVARFAQDPRGKRLAEHVEQSFLIACLEAHPDVMIDEQKVCSLKQWSNKRLDDMILVLRKHGKPLHYSAITERVNQRLPEDQQATAHNIHSQMGRLPNIFVRVGRGIFGLAEWGLVQENRTVDTAYRLLREAGQALYIEALIDRVLEIWHVQRASVKAAIDLDDRFEQVGRNLYWLKNSAQTQTDQGTAACQSDFDQMFGSLLMQRQQDLERDRISAEQTNDLEEIRRLDLDLLR